MKILVTKAHFEEQGHGGCPAETAAIERGIKKYLTESRTPAAMDLLEEYRNAGWQHLFS